MAHRARKRRAAAEAQEALRAERDRLIDDALDAVGLDHAAKSYPWQLSGGMQQRVAIARAVAYQPEVLIMDEPFAAVDAQTRADLEDLVRTLHRERGMSILFVTHDIDESVYLGERVIVLSKSPTWVQEDLAIDLAPSGTRSRRARSRGSPSCARTCTSRSSVPSAARPCRVRGGETDGADGAGGSVRSRKPKQLLLAFFGEHVFDPRCPLRASVLIEVLEGAGVAAPATRATSTGWCGSGLLEPRAPRPGDRFSLTERTAARCSARPPGASQARTRSSRTARVDPRHVLGARGPADAARTGCGPPSRGRASRRSATGCGSRPARSTWPSALEPLQADLPPGAVNAFRARELPGSPWPRACARRGTSIGSGIEHLAFIDTWSDPRRRRGRPAAGRADDARRRLAGAPAADPRLPRQFMDDDWPADRSSEVYTRHRRLASRPRRGVRRRRRSRGA